MRKKLTLIIFSIFVCFITFFYIFGEEIRDHYSPHVEVMPPLTYIFPDGSMSLVVLKNSCFSTDDEGKTTAYIVEENNASGEKAFYAKKIELIVGKSDENCSEIKKSPIFNTMFISSTDRNITDGDRVVIDRIVNSP